MSLRLIARCLMLLLAAWLPLQSAAAQWAGASMPVAGHGPALPRAALSPGHAVKAESHRAGAGVTDCHQAHETVTGASHAESAGMVRGQVPSDDGSHPHGCPDCLACIGGGAAVAAANVWPVLPALPGIRIASLRVRFASLASIPPDPPPIA